MAVRNAAEVPRLSDIPKAKVVQRGSWWEATIAYAASLLTAKIEAEVAEKENPVKKGGIDLTVFDPVIAQHYEHAKRRSEARMTSTIKALEVALAHVTEAHSVLLLRMTSDRSFEVRFIFETPNADCSWLPNRHHYTNSIDDMAVGLNDRKAFDRLIGDAIAFRKTRNAAEVP